MAAISEAYLTSAPSTQGLILVRIMTATCTLGNGSIFDDETYESLEGRGPLGIHAKCPKIGEVLLASTRLNLSRSSAHHTGQVLLVKSEWYNIWMSWMPIAFLAREIIDSR
jgi:hypothetical protein